ncbi:MAG: hypothetical protein QGH66_03800 [Dehalococcoidia bacterium]|jgi:hypothetical protein|nr:hypothetical protein [Dehalococcoidia bacterium]
MEGEYRTVGLHPSGHVMAYLRKGLGEQVVTSRDVPELQEVGQASVAGLVIRRQQPLVRAVFIPL